MASAVAQAYNGSLVAETSAGPGAVFLIKRSEGKDP